MRVVMGRSYTRAIELLHADLNLRQAAVVLELRVFGHIDSRIFGLHRSERNSIEANPCFAPDLIHRRRGAGSPNAPRDAEWGERYFHITDPDGHELSFARPVGAAKGEA